MCPCQGSELWCAAWVVSNSAYSIHRRHLYRHVDLRLVVCIVWFESSSSRWSLSLKRSAIAEKLIRKNWSRTHFFALALRRAFPATKARNILPSSAAFILFEAKSERTFLPQTSCIVLLACSSKSQIPIIRGDWGNHSCSTESRHFFNIR